MRLAGCFLARRYRWRWGTMQVRDNGEVELRGYRPSDLQAMFALDEVCFEQPFRFDLRAMRRFAEAPGALVVIASTKATLAGLCGFAIVHLEGVTGRRRGYVVTLDVAPQRRRSGVASLLMDEAESLAAEVGAGRMALHVFTGNAGAMRFYEARGYERTGLQRGFYGMDDSVSRDGLVYSKRLSRS